MGWLVKAPLSSKKKPRDLEAGEFCPHLCVPQYFLKRQCTPSSCQSLFSSPKPFMTFHSRNGALYCHFTVLFLDISQLPLQFNWDQVTGFWSVDMGEVNHFWTWPWKPSVRLSYFSSSTLTLEAMCSRWGLWWQSLCQPGWMGQSLNDWVEENAADPYKSYTPSKWCTSLC